ncbi:MAG TPA: alpha/beta hydrolase [Phototrophicaceae bacterium]|jgi:pimeloyl-ACP methyl ester carboxylesterase|nr:alpha/beta hydrolase [Phototrophicaceae bacterium]
MIKAQNGSGFAEINGAKLYYEVAGNPDGETLVFVHAGVADSRLWDDQVPFFGGKYRVIRYDMRGFGKSEPVEGEYAHRDDLYALLQHFDVEKTHLVGCSMGGGFCLDNALLQPQIALSVTMVCSGPGGLNLDIEAPALAAKFEQAEALWGNRDIEAVNEIETQIWFDGISRTPADVDPVVRAKALDMNRIALTHEAKGLGKHKPPMQPSTTERLGELHLPILMIVGALDTPYIQAASDYMVEHVPSAKKVIIQNTAHLPSMERPGEFNQILMDFLNSL